MADKRQKGVQNGVGCISGLCISLKGIFKMSEHLLQNFLPFVLSPNSSLVRPDFRCTEMIKILVTPSREATPLIWPISHCKKHDLIKGGLL
jgi:hypothetical protein